MTPRDTTRRRFLSTVGCGTAVLAASGALRAADRATPNIMMVLSDDHTQIDAGCYGSRVARTPNIDRLAREGMRFDNACTPTAMCVPSRATLYTGLYPVRNGVAYVELPAAPC